MLKKKEAERNALLYQRAYLKQQGVINHEYKEHVEDLKSEFVKLVEEFRATDDYEQKKNIAQRIKEIRGQIPIDIELELNEAEKHCKSL